MTIGEKLLELRKKNSFSQEEVAEKIGVARQTISKWELNETSPDLESSRKLAELYHVSLDEMVGNDVQPLIIEKVSNTEKLAGMIIKMLKNIGIFLTVWLITLFISIALSIVMRFDHANTNTSAEKLNSFKMACTLDNTQYLIDVKDDELICEDCTDAMRIDLLYLSDWADLKNSMDSYSDYFNDQGGSCSVIETESSIPID